MPIHHLLYRCPDCGCDPITPDGHGARCESCGSHFIRGERATVVTRPGSGPVRTTSAAALIDSIRVWEEKSPSGIDDDGELDYAAAVAYKRGVGQGTLYNGKVLTGFYETFSGVAPGSLKITNEGVGLAREDGNAFNWPWSSVRAVQTSSKSLQLVLKVDGLFDFRFDADSPRRWEELLHRRLQLHYEALGLHVREFQPRILTVALP